MFMGPISVVKRDLGPPIREDVGYILKLNLQVMMLIMAWELIVLDINVLYVENILRKNYHNENR